MLTHRHLIEGPRRVIDVSVAVEFGEVVDGKEVGRRTARRRARRIRRHDQLRHRHRVPDQQRQGGVSVFGQRIFEIFRERSFDIFGRRDSAEVAEAAVAHKGRVVHVDVDVEFGRKNEAWIEKNIKITDILY